jgi:hypothetical protein
MEYKINLRDKNKEPGIFAGLFAYGKKNVQFKILETLVASL